MLLDGGLGNAMNGITALHGEAFNPTDLHLNGDATLAGPRLRLTDGGRDEASSAYYTKPVNVAQGFETSFEFQLTSNGVDPLGSGFAFVIQSGAGVSSLNTMFTDQLGIPTTPHFAIKFSTYCPGYLTNDPLNRGYRAYSDNSTGIYVGLQKPDFQDVSEIHIPQDIIDLHSGHSFLARIEYVPPGLNDPGEVIQSITDLDTNLTWSHTYSNIDIQSIFRREDVVGEFAYAGFTAATGSPANPRPQSYTYGNGASTQDILNWKWDSDSPSPDYSYRGNFALDHASLTSGAVFDAEGRLVRTLWQNSQLAAGNYQTLWDGLDNSGSPAGGAASSGPYKIQVVLADVPYQTRTIANDTLDPSNWAASITSVWMNGLAVSDDGSRIWAAMTSGDTAGGGFVKVFDAAGNVHLADSQPFGFQQIGEAVAYDADSMYVLSEVQGWTGEFGIFKVDRATGENKKGFTATGLSNEDGSEVRTLGDSISYLSILRGTVGYHLLPAIAVSNPTDGSSGILWVSDLWNNLVRRYDKVTGRQIGQPIALTHPTGIAVDDAGRLWVAHGTAGDLRARTISIYSPDGAYLRSVSEIAPLQDVISLQISNGRLVVADNSAGQALVYQVSGTTVLTNTHPVIIGRPAAFGADDGRTTFWNLRGAAADSQGNIYTVQITTAPGGVKGTQLAKWSNTGEVAWVNGGYEYQSINGMYSQSDPGHVISSSLHRYKVDPTSGAWEYVGSAAYGGFDSNKWSGLPSTTPPSPPRVVNIGGADFYTLPVAPGNRLIFYRLDANGALHPSTILGTSGVANGLGWTWNDRRGDGIPLDSDIVHSGSSPGNLIHIFSDQAGNVWYQDNWNTIYKLPLQGLDALGNPIYDWSRAIPVVAVPHGMLSFSVGSDGIYAIYFDSSMGPMTSDSVYANYSLGGSNALCKFDLSGKLEWRMPLPQPATSVDVIPGGGAIIGNIDSTLYQVTGAGQLILKIKSATPGDMLDFGGGTILVSRNPIDGLIDVFAEGIAYSDSSWYRIDDRSPLHALEAILIRDGSVGLQPPTPGDDEPEPAPPDDPVKASATVHFVESVTPNHPISSAVLGRDGAFVAGWPQALPVYASVSMAGQSTWTWQAVTTDPRAVETPSGGRQASGWYSAGDFSIDLDLTDGETHRVTLYAVDWDTDARSQRIDVIDLTSGQRLDSRTISSFHDGVGLAWIINGRVRFVMASLSGPNAVISGIFFGDPISMPDAPVIAVPSVPPPATPAPNPLPVPAPIPGPTPSGTGTGGGATAGKPTAPGLGSPDSPVVPTPASSNPSIPAPHPIPPLVGRAARKLRRATLRPKPRPARQPPRQTPKATPKVTPRPHPKGPLALKKSPKPTIAQARRRLPNGR